MSDRPPQVHKGRRDAHNGQHTPAGGYIAKVPVGWITRAAATTLYGLRMALALLHLRGMRKSDSFRLSVPKQWKNALPRSHRSKGLAVLEAEGLVRVNREKGVRPLVTLIFN